VESLKKIKLYCASLLEKKLGTLSSVMVFENRNILRNTDF